MKKLLAIMVFVAVLYPVNITIAKMSEEAFTYYNKGMGLYYEGKYEESNFYYEKALEIVRKSKNKKDIAACLNQIGWNYYYIGQYEKALENFEEALEISRKYFYSWGIEDNLRAIGSVYNALNQYEKSLEYHMKELSTAKMRDDRWATRKPFYNIGYVYICMGKYNDALEYTNKALEIAKKIDDMKLKTDCLISIGFIYSKLTRYEEALKYYEEALVIAKVINPKTWEMSIYSDIGRIYNELSQFDKANEYSFKSLRLANEMVHVEGIYKSALTIGDSYKGLKKYDEAIEYYKISIDALEKLRSSIRFDEYRTSFMRDKMDVYKSLIELLVSLGRYEDAFNYMEQARSKAFLDLLESSAFNPYGKLERQILREDKKFQNELSSLSNKLIKDPGNSKVINEIKGIEKEYEIFIKEVRKESAEFVDLVSANALSLKKIQELLQGDISIIEYITTENNTYAFLVTRNNLKIYKLHINKDGLNNNVNNILLPNISNSNRRPESIINPEKLSHKISKKEGLNNRVNFIRSCVDFYNVLIKPLESDIETEKIIIIPYGSLHKVPFTALYDGEEYLIDKYSISILPSASVLAYIKDKGGSNENKLLAFADPKTYAVPLYYAETEVDRITKLFSSNKVYKKNGATETIFKKTSGGYDVVHMACHGEFNDRTPILSCLLLTKDSQNDGYLRLNELFGLDLSEANLVTLSACETALSEVQAGDDLVGMSRGLMYAGAESILASLWSVDDKSTAILMTKFYENWKSGMDKAEALRKAQIELKSIEGYEHPFYWAAFELIGDGG